VTTIATVAAHTTSCSREALVQIRGPPVVGNAKFPTLADDTLGTYRKLRALTPDIQLPGHPGQLFMGKLDAVRAGVRPHPLLVAPGEWVKGIDAQEAAFRKRMEADTAKLSAR
jgi:hypothetical protein